MNKEDQPEKKNGKPIINPLINNIFSECYVYIYQQNDRKESEKRNIEKASKRQF